MAGHPPAAPSAAQTLFYWVDHTARCAVNSGVQRVTRGLARGLLELGARVAPVCWDEGLAALVPASAAMLRHLAVWNGPVFPAPGTWVSVRDALQAPLRRGLVRHWGRRSRIAVHELPDGRGRLAGRWLLVPEVTHLTTHRVAPTEALLDYAARHGLRTAFVFYDALPLKHELYASMRSAHARYMAALAAADVVFPISEFSARDLRAYLDTAPSGPRPSIEPRHLPAELVGTPREQEARGDCGRAPLVLSVGSIDARKNQLALVRSFAALLRARPGFEGRLVLAGHLSPEVAPRLARFLEDARIRFVPAPDDPALAQLYRECAFTVFPSLEEGFGLPILESLWLGKPCICAEFGAMGEVAAGGGCLTVDVRSEDALTGALQRLLDDASAYARLAREAVARPLKTWREYAAEIAAALGRLEPRA